MEYSLRFVIIMLIYGITHKATGNPSNETTANTTTTPTPTNGSTIATTKTSITTAHTTTPSPTNGSTIATTKTSITTAHTTTPTPTNGSTIATTKTSITTAHTTTPTPTNGSTIATTKTSITTAHTTTPTPTNGSTIATTKTSITTAHTTTPTNGSTIAPTTTNTTTAHTTTPTNQSFHELSFLLTINEEFDWTLTNQNSDKFKTYSTKIKHSINRSYSSVSVYQPNSATVTGFRPGSVIADFKINSSTANPDLLSSNTLLVQSLRSEGFNVSDNPIMQSVAGGLYDSSLIYPGKDFYLKCILSVKNGITWYLNRNKLSQSDKYIMTDNNLTVKNANPSDSGEYACSTTVNSMPNINYQFITVQPYPNIQLTSSKVVTCEDTTIPLQCCFQKIYGVELDVNPQVCSQSSPVSVGSSSCLSCNYEIKKQDCQTTQQTIQVTCQLTTPINGNSYAVSSTVTVKNGVFTCNNGVFGAGNLGEIQTVKCTGNMVGSQVAKCNSSNLWEIQENNCVLRGIQQLKDEAENLQVGDIQTFMNWVSSNVTSETDYITDSAATITTIVYILKIVSNLSATTLIDQTIIKDFLNTTETVGSDAALDTWVLINKNNISQNASSELLKSAEIFGSRLPNTSFHIKTEFSSVNKTNITTSDFWGEFGVNLTTQISLPEITNSTFITIMVSSAFNNILPVRNLSYNDSSQTGAKINGDIAVIEIESNSTINNISLTFDVINDALGNPQCVFWNFSLLNGVGGWDSTGCQLKPLGNETKRYTCECNHTTSFSILMSPYTMDKIQGKILDYITYIGVGISMLCLVLCLIIEIIIWKSVTVNDTSYMRHVSVINIAVSLLIANICFIIGAAVVKQVGPCSTATFFMHFFYLALFFWMLLSALLLLYRTLMVFSRMTRGAMMGIGFTVGYGAPLIIAVITVASTAGNKGYIQQDYNCWLNWSQTKALLAFVIPALTIVAINLLVLIVVLFKMLRRGVNASIQPDEKHPLVVLARCVAILTPLFGLTWGFGIGTMVSSNFGIHVVFAFLNSLQGFFILLFGILLDSKVREALAGKFSLRNLSSNRTRSTSAGPSSSSGFAFIQRLRRRNVYNVSNGEMLSSGNPNASADG
ncbi:adhesion G-protein coupled receptor F1-like [Hemibagrus wyckioides]|uniref:adhesion G-protein coupled receptor F1-like n=1 Tax=Hemibagrus wyckioides TaxID=337641 RepID=UPI00266C4B16|nr:adhesion G-protein coupled receptor F1-like [Hemibagrus wyckioides]